MNKLKLSDFLPLFNTKGEGMASSYKIFAGSEMTLIESFGELTQEALKVDLIYQKKKVGEFHAMGLNQAGMKLWAQHLSVLLGGHEGLERERFAQHLKVLAWVDGARKIAPQICQWTGIYYKTSYLNGEESTDLVLGPYIGAATDHVRIPINRGFCGMALREEKTVNVADVNADDTHIACSLTTRSELVIPLKNSAGEMIAELDIDSDQLNAFSAELQAKFENYASTFSAV